MALRTNFLFGTGYNSVWLTEEGRRLAEKFEMPHAHNGYLETYLNLGIIGTSLLIIVLLSACRNAANQVATGSMLGPFLVTLCLSGIIYNYSEVTFGRDNPVSFGLMLAAIRISHPSPLRDSVRSPLPVPRKGRIRTPIAVRTPVVSRR
jgi:O-antigen ligase